MAPLVKKKIKKKMNMRIIILSPRVMAPLLRSAPSRGSAYSRTYATNVLKEAEQMIYATHALKEAAQLANLPRLDRHHQSPVVSAYLSTYEGMPL